MEHLKWEGRHLPNLNEQSELNVTPQSTSWIPDQLGVHQHFAWKNPVSSSITDLRSIVDRMTTGKQT